ncbi:hypothetical protein [Saccharothrix obliqua]|uniref:hypothetical protein n=1 Tax=Saccharothrix obliqua TaxID=2861747 RepID=UPI001C5FD68A|nr:hypothetical protein [Saccharothrix obliqua]MBW4718173.1 hypothetical protein [Saccharothrix obliqua]
MSTSPKPDAATAPVTPHEEQADFLGNGFGEARQACGEAVAAEPALPYVAYFSQGVFAFSSDLLGTGFAGRDALRQLGRRLAYLTGDLDRVLQEPRTGPLIRAVLQTEHGAVLCDTVVPRECVVAVTRGVPGSSGTPLTDVAPVNSADRALSALVTRLRNRISLPSLNHGGWESVGTAPAAAILDDEQPRVEEFDAVPDELTHAFRATVRPHALQYLAYYTEGDLVLEADHLGHPSLGPFFTQIAVDTRRTFYRVFGRELDRLARRLNRVIAGAEPGGLLRRLVLDVEQGAIYYYRLDVGTYLVGVTIDQSRVRDADTALARLASTVVRG